MDFIERLAEARDWSDVERTLLLQCVFSGKAQEAFAAMTAEDSSNYQLVKAAVLQAFELVPEAYRQRFRLLRKEKQSHMEFARDLTTSLNRWCVSSQVKTLEDLQELGEGLLEGHVTMREAHKRLKDTRKARGYRPPEAGAAKPSGQVSKFP